MIGIKDNINLPYKYAREVPDREQQQEPIKITWNLLQEIDTYDEQFCKRLLKQMVRERLHQSSQNSRINILEKSEHEKIKQIEHLKFKFKVCYHWPDCKSKGTHKRGYIDMSNQTVGIVPNTTKIISL
jgi:hypothetical protein